MGSHFVDLRTAPADNRGAACGNFPVFTTSGSGRDTWQYGAVGGSERVCDDVCRHYTYTTQVRRAWCRCLLFDKSIFPTFHTWGTGRALGGQGAKRAIQGVGIERVRTATIFICCGAFTENRACGVAHGGNFLCRHHFSREQKKTRRSNTNRIAAAKVLHSILHAPACSAGGQETHHDYHEKKNTQPIFPTPTKYFFFIPTFARMCVWGR